jgi:hypothetical protein
MAGFTAQGERHGPGGSRAFLNRMFSDLDRLVERSARFSAAGARMSTRSWRTSVWLGARLDGGAQIRPPNYEKFSRVDRVVISVSYYKERAYWGFLKAQIGKSYDTLAIATFAFNRDWRSPDAWFCDELVAAGLERAEVVRRLAPGVNRLDVRDLYLVVSAIAPVS